MVIGLSIHTFTIVHVVISLIAIASGLIVLFGMLGANPYSRARLAVAPPRWIMDFVGRLSPKQTNLDSRSCHRFSLYQDICLSTSLLLTMTIGLLGSTAIGLRSIFYEI
jgi:hypothetical protein